MASRKKAKISSNKTVDSTASEQGPAIDRHFFEALTDEALAQHVFPSCAVKKSKEEIILNYIEKFFQRFGLRLCYSKTANKWYPGTKPGDDVSKMKPVPAFFKQQSFVDLYCKDCRDCRDSFVHSESDSKHHGEMHVVATLQFSPLRDGKELLWQGKVSCLYSHNLHNDGAALKQLMSSGWCVLKTPTDTKDVYQAAIDHCRDVFHPPKGKKVSPHEYLNPVDKTKEKPLDNCYRFLMSGNGWDHRLLNSCCNDRAGGDTLVQLSMHRQIVVSLFYAICNMLGLKEVASAYVYTISNFRINRSKIAPNKSFRLFCNEDSLLAGGFPLSSTVPQQQSNSGNADHFVGKHVKNYPPTTEDIDNLLAVGMSFVHPLTEEGRQASIMKSSIHVTSEQTLLCLGNAPHGGATHHIQKSDDSRPLWPALHVHVDVKGCPRRVGYLDNGNEEDTHVAAQTAQNTQNKRARK